MFTSSGERLEGTGTINSIIIIVDFVLIDGQGCGRCLLSDNGHLGVLSLILLLLYMSVRLTFRLVASACLVDFLSHCLLVFVVG